MAGREMRALRFWLGLQVAASLVANWLGAEPTWEARLVAVPAPLILFGSIEAMLRIPGGGDFLSLCRGLGTVAVGAGAAFLSFRHIGHLGAAAGLTLEEQVAFVIILDGGMMVVALTLLMVSKQARPVRQRKPRPRPEHSTVQPQPLNRPNPARASLEVPEPDLTTLALAAGPSEEMTIDQRRDLVALSTNSGDTAAQIADATGAHIRTIRRDLAWLREAGRLDPEQEETAA